MRYRDYGDWEARPYRGALGYRDYPEPEYTIGERGWDQHPWNREAHSGYSQREQPGLLRRLFGRGPKGYKRSDERICEEIHERLYFTDYIDSTEVSVDVRDGKATLEGTVPERRMKHAIEDIVASSYGVDEIDNRIRVQR